MNEKLGKRADYLMFDWVQFMLKEYFGVIHTNRLGADIVRCNQYKKGVNGYTRISKKYLIKYGYVGNQ